jgi:hypothetical protein
LCLARAVGDPRHGRFLGGSDPGFSSAVFLSEQKLWIFSGAGLMLLANAYYLFKTKDLCPFDPILGRACQRAKKWSWAIWIVSVLLFALGGFVTFLVPLFFF